MLQKALWHTPIILALGKLRQEGGEFGVSLFYFIKK
jgi:hypothetical protein